MLLGSFRLVYCAALALNFGAGRPPGAASHTTNLLRPAHRVSRCDSSPRCSAATSQDDGKLVTAAAPVESLYPAWPVWERPPADYNEIVSTFVEIATAVPLKASSEKGDGWQTWADGGFAAHLLISRKMSRQNYVSVLKGLLELVVRIQQKYPDLYAVVKVSPRPTPRPEPPALAEC